MSDLRRLERGENFHERGNWTSARRVEDLLDIYSTTVPQMRALYGDE